MDSTKAWVQTGMEEFATSSVETGKCQCLEDGVEPPDILHGEDKGSSD